jgi:hypothetical protein
MNPIKRVPIIPRASPALLKANGIARTPVPKLPFAKWIKVSRSLNLKKYNLFKIIN